MRKSIFRSILLVALAVALVCFAIILNVLYGHFSDLQSKRLSEELSLAAIGVEKSGEAYIAALPRSESRLTWIAADGTVLADTEADAARMDNHNQREEVAAAREIGYGQSVRESATLTQKTIYRAQRLSDGSVLRISCGQASAVKLVMGMIQPMLLIICAGVALAAILARRLSAHVLRPLTALNLDEPLENKDAYEELTPLLTRLSRQQRKISEQMNALRRQSDEFRQITHSMQEGLVLLDGAGVVLSINPAAQTILKTDASAVGQQFLTVDRSHSLTSAINEALAGRHGEACSTLAERVYQFDVSAIQSSGQVIGAVMLIFDVTERTFAERNRREFTANVSHELKTPIQSIMGSAELMENGMVKPEDIPLFMGRIRRESARLVTLIEDIIRLSQLDEGAQTPLESVDLLSIAQDAAASLRTAAESRKVSIEVTGASLLIRGNGRMLHEIIYNLADNAIKYNTEGGSVTISLESSGAQALLTVTDSGIGIPPEHQARVFERFYRVDKSHSKASGGTGLGLSIVKHAVQAHHGTIKLVSQIGKGTTVQVTLPING